MSSSTFFVLSFGGPIVGGGLLSAAVWLTRDWLAEHSAAPLPGMLVAFIIGAIAARKIIHAFVPVQCPKCEKTTAYEMDGIPCRFRCHVCWKEF
jgi:hypothetical protein